MDMEKLLKKSIGHKIDISYIAHMEGTIRMTSGILKKFDEDIIHLELHNSFNEKSDWYLNRHVCILYTIVDYGV